MIAPFRIALFIALSIAAYIVTTIVCARVFDALHVRDTGQLLFPILIAAALLVVHYYALRTLERGASWSFVGLGAADATPPLLSGGLVLGVIGIGVPSALLLVTHQLRAIDAPAGNWWITALRGAIFLLPAALIEELFLRGYVFAVLRQRVGWKWALIGTSVTFGLLHLNNPESSPQSTLIVIIAGFFLGMVLLATRSLYAAWMAHFAWNWTMAALLHTAVSGIPVLTPGYRIVSSGPEWLTGGAWGPEGGFAAGVSMIILTLFLYGRFVRPALPARPARVTPLHS